MLLFAGAWVLALSACVSDNTKAKNRSNGNDTTPPKVVVVKPKPGSDMLETNAIVVAFDEAMDTGSLVLGGALAAESDGGVWSSDDEILAVKPATTWGLGDGRTLTIDAADPAGNSVARVGLSYDIFDMIYSPIGDASNWLAFDPGVNGVGTTPDGYAGGVFDGRYIYFVPHIDDAAYHGEVMRYDTSGTFADPASWSAFDAGANGVGIDPDGFNGGVFDGRYVYFVPFYNGAAYHGEVMRYDTSGPFADPASWSTFDAGANGVGTNPDGFVGGVFDGRYVYFVPFYNDALGFFGEVMRYDTSGTFDDPASWNAFDAGANGVGTSPDGFAGGVFDGRYVYFVPYFRGGIFSGEVMRYDTSGTFADPASWSAFDAGANGVGASPDGFHGAVFDGRYVYFVPHQNSTGFHGEAMRYDTLGTFADPASWSAFDAGANGVGTNPDGYWGGAFDGRYVYFVPHRSDAEFHGEVMRYDTSGTFADPASWSTFDAGANGVGTNPDGFIGAVFDGRYLYFVPHSNSTEYHGEVLRFDVKRPSSVPDTIFGGSFF